MRLWIAGSLLIAVLAFLVITFNELIVGRNRARTAWSNIDVQLQRRHDLIPPLAASVKGYADHERATLSEIAELRSRALAGAAVAQRGQIEAQLATQLARLLALQESYPELKASGNFLQLQNELVAIEEALLQARRDYNLAVRDYNTQIETFPDVLLARPFGFARLDFFQAEEDAAAVPKVG